MNIFCIGRNYAAHAEELGNEIPNDPVVFMKPASALLQEEGKLPYPSFTKSLHYECELVIRISKEGSNIDMNEASDYYDAIALGFDFTARDVQDECKKKGLPWEKAKAFDNSAAVSEFQAMDKLPDNNNILFSLKKNGKLVQSGDTGLLLFDFEQIISHVSTYFRLQKGDYIFTGTPAGVGPCVAGDVLEAFLFGESKLKVELV